MIESVICVEVRLRWLHGLNETMDMASFCIGIPSITSVLSTSGWRVMIASARAVQSARYPREAVGGPLNLSTTYASSSPADTEAGTRGAIMTVAAKAATVASTTSQRCPSTAMIARRYSAALRSVMRITQPV